MHRTISRSLIPAAASVMLAFALTAIVPSIASAQQPASPPPAVKHDSAAHPAGHDMGAMMGGDKMCPMMKMMHHPAGPMPLPALAAPETAAQLAAFTRNYYNALIAKGFTKDEALKIVIAVAIPVVTAPPPPMEPMTH